MVVDLYKSVAKVERNKSRPMKANPSDALRSCIIIIAMYGNKYAQNHHENPKIIIAVLKIIMKTPKSS